ncbi:hypothetical protein LXA43DRAFT_1102727 [Ganoderma leucocontextum]|nr:hypothetical protein LXA43DRAFT_1102727 [Ganoderma leucocontextum]
MRIAQEKIFGPMCVIIKFADEADIVRQANDTVWSSIGRELGEYALANYTSVKSVQINLDIQK